MEKMVESNKNQHQQSEISYETRLKVRVGKPSLDWLLDHLPEPVDLSTTISLDETLT